MNSIAASNTCIAVVQDAKDAVNDLNAQISGINNRVSYVANVTVPNTLIRVDRGLDIFDKATNIGYIVAGGMAFTAGVVFVGTLVVGIWRLIQWKYPNLRHTDGVDKLTDDQINAVAENLDRFIEHPKFVEIMAKIVLVVHRANTQNSDQIGL